MAGEKAQDPPEADSATAGNTKRKGRIFEHNRYMIWRNKMAEGKNIFLPHKSGTEERRMEVVIMYRGETVKKA